MARRSSLYLSGLTVLSLAAGILLLQGAFAERQAAFSLAESARLVRELDLTDLCLFTEASYTRHPAVTDLSTPFQDGPLSLEHFPTGSLVGIPPHLTKTLARAY
ncbi:hypothetical protein [Geomesophilobacter sediminis]|uniref:Uncharacterized protein n=1 Tax=Geomesophilobacter sediminis TaxID=2798584 RepID=A0A8J7M4Z5_9BACT|nr:hypothetical protein [Geomesophilobacter sediminis]MBJ6727998.1 hypothetical protein [Geomesophilobacter sediminis]